MAKPSKEVLVGLTSDVDNIYVTIDNETRGFPKTELQDMLNGTTDQFPGVIYNLIMAAKLSGITDVTSVDFSAKINGRKFKIIKD